ncbi:hypothetical protein AB0N21_02065 [Streptomyces sp. NPDC051080]|uniref:hypothetical protein n=1 Tax=Streptomyces sp. NPDC051080 TaxID=3157222 RepID=UPI00341730A4
MISGRLVFVNEVSAGAFSDFAENQHNWTLNDERDPDADFDEDRPSVSWTTPVGLVTFIDDTVVRCQYIEMTVSSVVDVESKVREIFSCYDREEALANVDLEQDEVCVRRDYRLVACVAGDYNHRVFELAVEGLRSSRSDIRESALIIPQYTHWVEFIPEVTRLGESDPDSTVRRIAGGISVLLEFVAELE